MATASTLKVGEVWRVHHSRKGALTLRILQDVDLTADDPWINAEIVNGKVIWLSGQNRMAQKEDGLGTPGDVLTVRASLTGLIEKVAE